MTHLALSPFEPPTLYFSKLDNLVLSSIPTTLTTTSTTWERKTPRVRGSCVVRSPSCAQRAKFFSSPLANVMITGFVSILHCRGVSVCPVCVACKT